MSDLALRGLEDAVEALTTRDKKIAYKAILRDSRVDDLERLIDNMCVEFMVRHIPVAKHLRFAHSVAKIILEVERIGDYGESINRQAILLSDAPRRPDFDKFAKLAGAAIEMVRQAIRAFLDEDEALADKTRAMDAKTNTLHQEIFRDLIKERPESSEDLSTLFSMLSVANRFERVADQAKNICDEVTFIITGEMVKHRLHKDLKVLFVSSSNSCRSLMAEGIAKTIAGDHFEFCSAGVDAGEPDEKALAFLGQKGIDLSKHEAQTIVEMQDLGTFKAVVAIGADAAASLPPLGYRTIMLEWDVNDPSQIEGDDATLEAQYAAVFDELVERTTYLIRGLHGTISDTELGDLQNDS